MIAEARERANRRRNAGRPCMTMGQLFREPRSWKRTCRVVYRPIITPTPEVVEVAEEVREDPPVVIPVLPVQEEPTRTGWEFAGPKQRKYTSDRPLYVMDPITVKKRRFFFFRKTVVSVMDQELVHYLVSQMYGLKRNDHTRAVLRQKALRWMELFDKSKFTQGQILAIVINAIEVALKIQATLGAKFGVIDAALARVEDPNGQVKTCDKDFLDGLPLLCGSKGTVKSAKCLLVRTPGIVMSGGQINSQEKYC